MQTYSFGLTPVLLLRNICLLLALMPATGELHGQDSLRFSRNIRFLCGGELAGRGYLYNGHELAAHFIDQEFRRAGLRPAGGSFLQAFPVKQNVFPGRPALELNGRKLQPGRDFIPAPASPPLSGTFRIDSSAARAGGNAVLLREKQDFFTRLGDEAPALVLRLQDKLTHSLAAEQKGIPEIRLKASAFLPGDSLIQLKFQAREKKVRAWNVAGMVRGTDEPDSFLVFCAHYDHLGSFGRNTWFPGANDNASGVAMLLELARYTAEHPLRYSVLFVAFSGEEAGLLGSRFMAENPPVPLAQIRFLFNLDLLGFGEKGATVVNATLHPQEFSRLMQVNENCRCLPEIKARGKAANSDHFPFSEKGVPAFFMYLMGGPGHYHDVNDKPETLSLQGFRGTFRLLTDFMKGF